MIRITPRGSAKGKLFFSPSAINNCLGRGWPASGALYGLTVLTYFLLCPLHSYLCDCVNRISD